MFACISFPRCFKVAENSLCFGFSPLLPQRPKKRRATLMSFNNPGGSIGNGLLVLLAGWCVHCVAKHLAAQASANRVTPAATAAARQAGKLTLKSLQFLVAHSPVPFVLIDIRDDKSSKVRQKAVRFRDAVQVSEALSDPNKWQSIAKGAAPCPAPSHLLIFIHDSKAPLHAAVSAAFNSNFVHCFTIPSKKLASAKSSEDLSEAQYISTDAVAHLISLKSVSCDLKAPILVDEPPATFEEVAGTPAWSKDDLLIFHSRESLRARWAAQLASERGYQQVFVCTEGSNGWRFNPLVHAYPRYQLGQPVPQGHAQTITPVDTEVGAADLRALGLL